MWFQGPPLEPRPVVFDPILAPVRPHHLRQTHPYPVGAIDLPAHRADLFPDRRVIPLNVDHERHVRNLHRRTPCIRPLGPFGHHHSDRRTQQTLNPCAGHDGFRRTD
jgi:hypothetical protein